MQRHLKAGLHLCTTVPENMKKVTIAEGMHAEFLKNSLLKYILYFELMCLPVDLKATHFKRAYMIHKSA